MADKKFFKIVILGDSDVGKTTLLQQYVSSKVSQHAKPTIGADFTKKELTVDGTNVTLQIWDTAGQERFQSLGYAFYRGSDCCALVFDITSKKSFENLSKWKAGFLENAAPQDPNNFPFVVLGNKVDREPERKVDSEKAESWCKQNGNLPYFETSAKANINVDEAFVKMARTALERDKKNPKYILPKSLGEQNAGGQGGKLKLTKDKRVNNQTQNKCEC